PPRSRLLSTLLPYTTLFRSLVVGVAEQAIQQARRHQGDQVVVGRRLPFLPPRTVTGEHGRVPQAAGGRRRLGLQRLILAEQALEDRKSTRLNSSHQIISYAV